MMITNLPSYLSEEILSRVPLKLMRAVRLTCRKWNTLSKGQIFAKMHFGKAFPPKNEGESRMIVMMEENLYLMSIFDNLSIEHRGKLICLDEQVKISQVFHCEGLLLCILKDDDTKVVVWNPYLGQTRWIETRYPHVLCEPRQPNINMFSYALGYEDKGSCRNYKLLRFIDFFLYKSWDEFVWYEIYDFESGLWTTLDVSPHWRIISRNGVSLKGNAYWFATKRNSDARRIICFDYTRERFGPLLALPHGMGRPDFVTLSCVKEEKLGALCYYDQYDVWISIWIASRIEAEKVSWSKFWKLELDSSHIWLTFQSFYIDEVKKVAMLFGQRCNYHTVCIIKEDDGDYFNEEDGHVELVDLQERTEENCLRPRVCSYVPSLVQIIGGQRGKKQE